MNFPSENEWTVRFPLNPYKGRVEGGLYDMHLVLDPRLLPKVCVHCADEGIIAEKFFFMEDLPRAFWRILAAAAAIPVLFAFVAFLIAKMGGQDLLRAYASSGGMLVAIFSGITGFIAARKAAERGRYALVFYLCRRCEATYRRLSRSVITLSWAAVALFGSILLSPLLWIGAPERARSVSIAVMVLVGALVGATLSIFWFHLDARRFRGVAARWRFGERTVKVTFRNLAVGALAASQSRHSHDLPPDDL